MIKIKGINHSRYVGIDKEGQPCAFNPENAGGVQGAYNQRRNTGLYRRGKGIL